MARRLTAIVEPEEDLEEELDDDIEEDDDEDEEDGDEAAEGWTREELEELSDRQLTRVYREAFGDSPVAAGLKNRDEIIAAMLDGDEEDDEADEEAEQDPVEEWTEFTPQILSAIEKGFLDLSLKKIAFTCRERYRGLHPEEFPGETAAPTREPIDYANLSDVLGRNGDVVPVLIHGVGAEGKMPNGSIRLNGNAYAKRNLEGRIFQLHGAYNPQTRGAKFRPIPAGTLFEVVSAADKRFTAKVFDAERQLELLGFSPAEILAATRGDFLFRYEYHTYLFQDGGKSK